MAACAKKPEEKIEVNRKKLRMGLHKPLLMEGGKFKKYKKCCVVKDIEHPRGQRGND